jgi:YtcA family
MFERAPSVDLLGSFFPIWMVCIAAAVGLTMAVRWLLTRTNLEAEVGPRVIVYPSMVVLFACGIWFVCFRY